LFAGFINLFYFLVYPLYDKLKLEYKRKI